MRLVLVLLAAVGAAGILAWAEKYRYDWWRPVLGIREHDSSMGPTPLAPTSQIAADCDSERLPLGAPASTSTERNTTPPFPA
jgi:hypothetical protein